MKSIRFLSLVALLSFAFSVAFAENNAAQDPQARVTATSSKTLKGKVFDENGEPLPGATVRIAGTDKGTITDIDGSYSISEVSFPTKILVSFMGYKELNISLSGREQMPYNITLSETDNVIDEVVVVGYGTQRKKLVTTSTVNVTGEKIAATNSVDVFGSLQSQAAGINITSNSGQPGESYKVTIRGMGTIGDSNPLYVIDGVPGGDITALSPNDIESIDVLKDAASSAIYGARAANGVILVTTKKGKPGKTTISYDGYFGIQNPNTNDVKPLNAKQYIEINSKAYEIQGTAPYDFASLIPNYYDDIMSGKWEGTNWLDKSINHNAPITNHSITMTGGNDLSRFALGLTYFKQDGTIGYPADPSYDRFTARMNSDYTLWKVNGRDIVRFGENITFTVTNKTTIKTKLYPNHSQLKSPVPSSPYLAASTIGVTGFNDISKCNFGLVTILNG